MSLQLPGLCRFVTAAPGHGHTWAQGHMQDAASCSGIHDLEGKGANTHRTACALWGVRAAEPPRPPLGGQSEANPTVLLTGSRLD